eukprot:364108-Chlamydomonas_euryale.AAC.4
MIGTSVGTIVRTTEQGAVSGARARCAHKNVLETPRQHLRPRSCSFSSLPADWGRLLASAVSLLPRSSNQRRRPRLGGSSRLASTAQAAGGVSAR